MGSEDRELLERAHGTGALYRKDGSYLGSLDHEIAVSSFRIQGWVHSPDEQVNLEGLSDTLAGDELTLSLEEGRCLDFWLEANGGIIPNGTLYWPAT